MNSKILKIIAIVGTPFLSVDSFIHGRLVPLMVVLWFPLSILLNIPIGLSATSMMASVLCSAIAWVLLSYVAYTSQSVHKLQYSPVTVRQ